MREDQTTSSANPANHSDHLLHVPDSIQHRRQQHVGIRRWGAGGGWRQPLPSRGSDVNLLANSLTSWLRRNALPKAEPGAGPTPADSGQSGAQHGAAEGCGRKFVRMSPRRQAQVDAVRSILKKSSAKDAGLFESSDVPTSSRPRSPVDEDDDEGGDDRLHRNVVHDRRSSSGAAGDPHQTPTPAALPTKHVNPAERSDSGSGSGSRGFGGHDAGSHSLGSGLLTSDRSVKFVKRLGIFQPEDKYAPGRQLLHRDDHLFAKHPVVDFETLTLQTTRNSSGKAPSIVANSSPESRSRNKKALKVSWKSPDISGDKENEEESRDSRRHDGESSARLTSSGCRLPASAESSVAWQRPRFSSGKSAVPAVGVTWKLALPIMRARAQGRATCLGGDPAGRSPRADVPGHEASIDMASSSAVCTSSATRASALKAPSSVSCSPPAGCPSAWRKALPRDVHPVTSAMAREGTSVSKTKWHVPSSRAQGRSDPEGWQRPLLPLYLRPVNNEVSSGNPSMQVQGSDHSKAASAL